MESRLWYDLAGHNKGFHGMVWSSISSMAWWPYGGLVISSNFYILIWLGMLEHGNTKMASSYDMVWIGVVVWSCCDV